MNLLIYMSIGLIVGCIAVRTFIHPDAKKQDPSQLPDAIMGGFMLIAVCLVAWPIVFLVLLSAIMVRFGINDTKKRESTNTTDNIKA